MSEGQAAVTHRPRWGIVGRILLRQSAAFQVLLLPPLGAAVLDGETSLSMSLAGPAALCATATLLQRHTGLPYDIRRIEAVLSVVMVFILAVLLTAPAYLTLGLVPVDALFEATSAVTTTGFSMIAVPEALPVSAHVLRAWSQWCGGLIIAVAGLAFLMERGPAAKALGIADFGDETISSSVRAHARALIVVYVGITLAGVFGAIIAVPGYIEGPLLALAAVSTGGMSPRGDSLASYPMAAQVFVVLLGAAGGFSLAFPVLAKRHGIASAAATSAAFVYFKAILFGAVVASLLLFASGARSPGEIGRGFLNALSLQSTTGFTVTPIAGPAPLLVVLVFLMAVGGQTGSTAGGLKLDRARILFASVTLVLKRLLSPADAVLHLRVNREIVEPGRLLFAVALFVTYLLATLCLWAAFTLHGLPLAGSLFDTVSALSTVGAGTGVIGPHLPPDLKIATIFAMLLGRVEFFGLLVLVLPITWKRRG